MISPALILFLKGIAAHNDKQWYDAHKEEYATLRLEFTQLIEELGRAVAGFDPAVANARTLGTPTTKVFRIHRDARFAKPGKKYKTNIGGFVSADVQSASEPSYYLSIQPGGLSFIGGGLFMPERLVLSELRDKIETHPKQIAKIDYDAALRDVFPEGLSRAHSLLTAPRGHDKDHEAIEYLRLKSFTVGKYIADTELASPTFLADVVKAFAQLYQLNAFLRP